MTKRIGETVFIEQESSAHCELCKKVAELRPYGPNGEQICFACGMKDEKTTDRMFRRVLDGTKGEA